MEPISFLLAMALSYGGGYAHRYLTEPEVICRTVKYKVPEKFKTPLEPTGCKRGVNPVTGMNEECYVNEDPVYEFTKDQRIKLHNDIGELQGNLFECEQLTKEQRKNPKIVK